MKGGNKQEEAWINPFVKQFSNISFSVSAFPRSCLLCNGLSSFCPELFSEYSILDL